MVNKVCPGLPASVYGHPALHCCVTGDEVFLQQDRTADSIKMIFTASTTGPSIQHFLSHDRIVYIENNFFLSVF